MPPTQTNWDFKGWSLENPNTYSGTDLPELVLKFNPEYTSADDMYEKTEKWNTVVFDSDHTVYTLYAIFEIHAFTITFVNGDGNEKEIYIPFG
jgi:hypothetical protein